MKIAFAFAEMLDGRGSDSHAETRSPLALALKILAAPYRIVRAPLLITGAHLARLSQSA